MAEEATLQVDKIVLFNIITTEGATSIQSLSTHILKSYCKSITIYGFSVRTECTGQETSHTPKSGPRKLEKQRAVFLERAE